MIGKRSISDYVAAKADDPKYFDLSRHTFAAESDIDPALREAFEKKLKSYVDHRDPQKVLIDLVHQQGWNDDDLSLLAGVTAERYQEIFEMIESDDLGRIVQLALRMAGQHDEHALAMRVSLKEALSRIAKKSPLRARRLKGWGFNPDPN